MTCPLMFAMWLSLFGPPSCGPSPEECWAPVCRLADGSVFVADYREGFVKRAAVFRSEVTAADLFYRMPPNTLRP